MKKQTLLELNKPDPNWGVKNPHQREIDRINKLAGNQARILLLYLLSKGHFDNMAWLDLKYAFEIAETYSPESQLISF